MIAPTRGKADGNLASAVMQTMGKPYLGSMPELEQVLRDAIGSFITDAGKLKTGDEVGDLAKTRAEALARILAGENDAYAPMPGWNDSDGRLPAFLARTFEGFDAFTGRESILRASTQVFVDILTLLAKRSRDEIDDAGAEQEIDQTVEAWTSIFLGIRTDQGEDDDG